MPTNWHFPLQLTYQQHAIVSALRQHSHLSRTDLAKRLGYSRALMTGLVHDLVEHGIIHEAGSAKSTGGRRARMLTFNGDFTYVVGVDMGATSLDIAVADFKGTILAQASELIDVQHGPEPILRRVVEITKALLGQLELSPEQIGSIGIGVPGPVDFEQGLLIAPPIMPGWEGYPIRAHLNQDLPHATVIVDNDVNVMALGELSAGAAGEADHFIFVKVGTGIGCGIVVDRHIYRGSIGCAGDIGHIQADRDGPVCHCGNIGCLEAMASGSAIGALATRAARHGESPILASYLTKELQDLTAAHVAQAASEGDPVAVEIIKQSGHLLGDVLAGVVNFFNPSMIIIGGNVSKIGNLYLASIRQAILNRTLPLATKELHIAYSHIVDEVGVAGAIALALNHLFASPSDNQT